jgi:hypothetical protein
MNNYYQLERACFQIVSNQSDAVSIVNQVSPAGIAAMASSSNDIYHFYQGHRECKACSRERLNMIEYDSMIK